MYFVTLTAEKFVFYKPSQKSLCFRDIRPVQATTRREGVCHRIRVLLDENHV